MPRILIILALLPCLVVVAFAQTVVYVNSSAPAGGNGSAAAPFHTIQAGIIAAPVPAIVSVSPGVYNENINFLGKAIKLVAPQGPLQTIIDGGQAGPVVRFALGETFTSQLEGFSIRNGLGASSAVNLPAGGGIHCQGASPLIINCIIRDNTGGGALAGAGEGAGGGVEARGSSSPILFGCRITNNIGGSSFSTFAAPASAGGGGVNVNIGAPLLINCTLIANTGGNLAGDNAFSAAAGGGGLNLIGFSVANVVNCTFTGNTGGFATLPAGSAGGIHVGQSSVIQVRNTILWGNQAAAGVTVAAEVAVAFGNPTPIDVAYSIIQGGLAGTGNIALDPMFAAAASGNIRLSYGSPAVNAGTNNSPYLPPLDFEGHPRVVDGTVDIGVDELISPFGAAGAGTAGLALGQVVDVLRINATAGGEIRTVTAATFAPLSISVNPNPGHASSGMLIFANIGMPSAGDATATPWGTLCLLPGLLSPDPNRVVVTNSFDAAGGLVPSSPAPWTLSAPIGAPTPGTLAFQGLLINPLPGGGAEVVITNAVLLCIM